MPKDDEPVGKKTTEYTPAEAERFGLVIDERPPDSEATIVTASPNVKPELLPRGLKSRLYEGDLSSDPHKIRDVRAAVEAPAPPAAVAPRRAPEQPITTRTATRRAPGTVVISTTQLVIAVLVFSLVVVGAAGFVGYSLGRSRR